MKIEKSSEELTYMSKTKAFTLDIEELEDGTDKELEITKHWYDGDSYDVEWDFVNEIDRKWFEDLPTEEQDEIEDFIGELE